MIINFRDHKADGIDYEEDFSSAYLENNNKLDAYPYIDSETNASPARLIQGPICREIIETPKKTKCPHCGSLLLTDPGDPNVGKEINRPIVCFTDPIRDRNLSIIGGAWAVQIYWLEEIHRWVGFVYYSEMESSHSSSECHKGPYAVSGFLAVKLLEAYGITPSKLMGWETAIEHTSPEELQTLSKK